MPPRWAIFISGRGSNLAAALEVPGVDVRLVVSSRKSALGLAKAYRSGVPVLVSRDWSEIDQELRRRKVNAIFLLGFMRILPESFVKSWEGRILNVHPSLLPKYPGLRSIERAIEASDDCGVTVHQVSKDVDQGAILLQRRSFKGGTVDETFNEIATVDRAYTLVHIDEQTLVKTALKGFAS